MRDCPCLDCLDRTSTCHSNCEDYKKFEKQCKIDRERRYAERQSIYYSQSIEKFSRKKRRR